MKKQLLLLSATILITGLTSCKKENSKLADSPGTKNGPKLIVNTLPAATYNELYLIARKPGENYDTYYGTFHGSNVYVVGTPVYDQVRYPTLANGVPCMAQSMYSDNEGTIDVVNTGPDGNVFQISQGHMLYTDYNQIHSDFYNYFNAENTWIKAGATGVEPSIFSYVKRDYKSSTSSLDPFLYVGKLIRVTTGSHWALAEIDYPKPVASTVKPTDGDLNVTIVDPLNPHDYYQLIGEKNQILFAIKLYDNIASTGVRVLASGMYARAQPGTVIYHFAGTAIRADGSTFTFNITEDLS